MAHVTAIRPTTHWSADTVRLTAGCDPRRTAGHQGTTSRQGPSSLAQPCGLAGPLPNRPPITHAERHACTCVCLHVCAQRLTHADTRGARVRACAHLCPGAHSRTHSCARAPACPRARAHAQAYTNEPIAFWSRLCGVCAHVRMSLIDSGRAYGMCAHTHVSTCARVWGEERHIHVHMCARARTSLLSTGRAHMCAHT